MQRKPMVAGNWKMHGFKHSVADLVEAIKKGAPAANTVDVVLCPTFLHIAEVQHLIKDTKLTCGGQNLHPGTQGAYTGEVSGPMLIDQGCQYVLIGHSERRAIFSESLDFIAEKFKAAQDAGLTPILCVGETLDQRQKEQTEQVIEEQLASVINLVGIDALQRAVIAYEPVWAIGTGLTATPEQAQAVHAFIRSYLAKQSVAIAGGIRILYGGSVKPDNAQNLFAMPDIDGGLIGGASLDAKSFLAICEAANGHVVA